MSLRDDVLELFDEAQYLGRRPRWRIAIEYGEPRLPYRSERELPIDLAAEVVKARRDLAVDAGERAERRGAGRPATPPVVRADRRGVNLAARARLKARIYELRPTTRRWVVPSRAYPLVVETCPRCGGTVELRLGNPYPVHVPRRSCAA